MAEDVADFQDEFPNGSLRASVLGKWSIFAVATSLEKAGGPR